MSSDSTPEQMAFEIFAEAYPHEAAALDWPAFMAYVRRKDPSITEEEIRHLLDEGNEKWEKCKLQS